MTVLPVLLAALVLHWLPQDSHGTAGLRGLSVVSRQVAWAAGSGGTVLRTLNGGKRWDLLKVHGGEALDFRDVVAFDGRTALVLASGKGDASRIYVTENGGGAWTLVLHNSDADGFLDAMKFWDRQHGMLLGDPVAGRFTIYTTSSGGKNWERRTGPPAAANESVFAASGTSLTLPRPGAASFGSGGPDGGRVFHTRDGGATWISALTPFSQATISAGIFSVLFLDARRGVAAGGDYKKPSETAVNLAVSDDGGLTWTVPPSRPPGFRSGLAFIHPLRTMVAVGTSGSDYSLDGGHTWLKLSNDNLNAVAAANTAVWAVGPKGSIMKLVFRK